MASPDVDGYNDTSHFSEEKRGAKIKHKDMLCQIFHSSQFHGHENCKIFHGKTNVVSY